MTAKPLRLLVVEDNPGDVGLVRAHFEDGFGHGGCQITVSVSLGDAFDELRRARFDAVLLDLHLSDSSGLSTFLELESRFDCPVVILSGSDDESLASAAIQRGAKDYLAKDRLSGPVLVRTVRRAIERRRWDDQLRMRQERVHALEKLEAIGRLSDGLAHNFNNLLTAVVGNCELLAPLVAQDERARRCVGAIRAATGRAAALTRELMSRGRRAPAPPAPVAVGAALLALEGVLRDAVAPAVRVDVVVGGSASILIDSGQLEQVVQNLALNARDAMADGGTITISSRTEEIPHERPGLPDSVPSGRWAVVEVNDHGCGIDPSILPHIFAPFFTTKTTGRSPGLGLSTVQGIVKHSGGRMQLESRVGAGTTVRVFWPLLPPREEAATRPSRQRTGCGLETVLLVEDEAQVSAVLAESLSALGYRILVAASAEEALHLFEQHLNAVHLVVSDVDMPGVGGYELARRLKTLRPEVRIVFISGYAPDNQSGLVDEALVSAFLPKPFSAQALARTIHEVMQPSLSEAADS